MKTNNNLTKKLIKRSLFIDIAAPNITISDRPHIFVRNDGTINLTRTIVSIESPDMVAWYYNGTSIQTDQTQWQSKIRICMSDQTENCCIRTTFNLIIKAANSERIGLYSCATDKIQSANVYVEVLGDLRIKDSDMDSSSQTRILEYATEALELYGVQRVTDFYHVVPVSITD